MLKKSPRNCSETRSVKWNWRRRVISHGTEAAEGIASEIALRGCWYRHGEAAGLMTLLPLSRFPHHQCKLVREFQFNPAIRNPSVAKGPENVEP